MGQDISRPDHGLVWIGTVVKKPEPESNLRFQNWNQSISDFGSGLENQNREPNRRFTVQWRFGRFVDGSGGSMEVREVQGSMEIQGRFVSGLGGSFNFFFNNFFKKKN